VIVIVLLSSYFFSFSFFAKLTMVLFSKGILKGVLELKKREDDEWVTLQMLVGESKKTRKAKWKHTRIDWEGQLHKLRHTGGFQTRYPYE